MTAIVPDELAVARLRRGFGGDVIVADDARYDEARAVFNGMIDMRPGLIAQCTNVEDVAQAVRFGRELGMEIAVRGGGHSVAGLSLTDGGIVVDLRRMNAVAVDREGLAARVGGGATIADLDQATQPFGLATTGGRASTTGVGGFVLGGGSGWLERKFGLACDNLTAVEMVTATGDVVTASETENPDLFWGLHGGGGNFGVATSFTLRVHPLPAFTAAFFVWRQEAGPEVVRAYRDFISSAPDEFGGGFLYFTAPPVPFVPESLVGQLACAVLVTCAGGEAQVREAVEPLLALHPEGQMIAEMPYADLNSMMDDPGGHRNYWSAMHLASFPDEAVDVYCARAADMVVPSSSQHVLFPLGGAVGQGAVGQGAVGQGAVGQGAVGQGAVGQGAAQYPIPWRSAPWVVHPFGLWNDPADDERAKAWARNVRADMAPWSVPAVYLNFIGSEGEERLRQGFGADNYERLAKLKTKFDPENAFHRNNNIKPG